MPNRSGRLTYQEIREQLRRLNRIDPDAADYAVIRGIYDRLTDSIQITVGLSPGHELFFRARRNPSSKPVAISDIAAPPPERVTGFERCNPPGIPMFYASSKRSAAIQEVRAVAGDIVYLSQWIGVNQMPINRIFDTNAPYYESHDLRDDVIYGHLDTLFSKRIHATFSSDYKFTAAVSQLLTSKFESNSEHNIHSDGFVGLRYPSVIDRSAYNTAMHASFALGRLQLLHVTELRITRSDSGVVEAYPTDSALANKNGTFEWSGSPIMLPTLRGQNGAVRFRKSGDQFLLEVEPALATAAEFAALLDENSPHPL